GPSQPPGVDTPQRAPPTPRAVPPPGLGYLYWAPHGGAVAGDEPAESAGRHFVMLRDGAMAAGCLSDSGLVTETFLDGVEGILRARVAARPAGA
ncbi:hypothetical protein ACFC5H_20480, partial [Streptomyces rochei]